MDIRNASDARAFGPKPMRWPPSANGYLLIDDRGTAHYAAWAAPYFVFVGSDDPAEEPLGLIHCDDVGHARAVARHGGTILSADFSVMRTEV